MLFLGNYFYFFLGFIFIGILNGNSIFFIGFFSEEACSSFGKARKLAVIIWNMVVKKIPYNPPSKYEFLDQKRKRKVIEMRKLISKFEISTNELGFA